MISNRYVLKLMTIALLLFVAGTLNAQHNIKLRFKGDGSFKIVQFTDTHIVWNDSRSDVAFQCIDQVVKAEKPDLIMITGDIIYSEPAIDNFKKVMNYVSQYKIPFAFVFGNHDHQFNVTDSALLESVKNVPFNMTVTAKGVSGDCNFDLPIYASGGKKIEAVIYGIDSHNDSRLEKAGVKGYDYIYRDQIDWYVRTSKAYTVKNAGKPLPSLAFFHIPIPEYAEAAIDQNASLYGSRREWMCSSKLNSGLFCAMKEQGDVMGTFCGHDHDDDYAVNWYGVLLAYGRFSGGNTEYNHLNGNGARVIEIKQGERTIHTWIRLRSGEIQQNTEFPKDYVNK